MFIMNYKKYQKMYHPIPLEDRQWPNNEITHAPIWCSVDLRDGNQALYSPMTTEEKIEFFKFLVKLGFKEIELNLNLFAVLLTKILFPMMSQFKCLHKQENIL